MKLIVKIVPKCDNRHMGEFIIKGPKTCEIRISEKENKDLVDFSETLLHELLHFWIAILELQGIKCTLKQEHEFINGVTPMLLRRLAKEVK